MTDTATVESPNTDAGNVEFDTVYAALLAERDLDNGRATVVQVALARAAARILGDPAAGPAGAASVSSLLSQLPPVVRHIGGGKTDVEWDLRRLGNEQVLLLEELAQVATGKRGWFCGDRYCAAFTLVRLLDEAVDREHVESLPDFDRAKLHIAISNTLQQLLHPFRPADIVRSEGAHLTEALAVARGRIKQLERQVELLRADEKPVRGPSAAARTTHTLDVAPLTSAVNGMYVRG